MRVQQKTNQRYRGMGSVDKLNQREGVTMKTLKKAEMERRQSQEVSKKKYTGEREMRYLPDFKALEKNNSKNEQRRYDYQFSDDKTTPSKYSRQRNQSLQKNGGGFKKYDSDVSGTEFYHYSRRDREVIRGENEGGGGIAGLETPKKKLVRAEDVDLFDSGQSSNKMYKQRLKHSQRDTRTNKTNKGKTQENTGFFGRLFEGVKELMCCSGDNNKDADKILEKL